MTIRNALDRATTLMSFPKSSYSMEYPSKRAEGDCSYLTPDRTKPITARKLGNDFDRAAVLALLEQNAHRAAEQTAPIPEYHSTETSTTQREKNAENRPDRQHSENG